MIRRPPRSTRTDTLSPCTLRVRSTGFKLFYKGALASEIYTQLGQTDYAAEIAQIREADPDSIFFFLPGGMGIAFVKQYAQSGLEVPLFGPAFSFDQGILGAVGDAALGVKNTSQWSKDLANAANKAFVESFTKEYGSLPSPYATPASRPDQPNPTAP